jgi:hypothetical protein
MLRQEAWRDKGNVNSGGSKVIRYGWKTVGRLFEKKRIAGIQEGGIPAIQFGPNSLGPITNIRQGKPAI